MINKDELTCRQMSTNGITINARIAGNGPPLLFLGGSNFDLSIRAAVFDSCLPTHFTVAAADPRGLGKTDAPDGNWSMQDYAQDALDLIDTLGWQKTCVVGESFGAMVGLELAILAPERLTHLVLAAGAPGGEGGSSFAIETLQSIEDSRERAIRAISIQDSRFSNLLVNNVIEAENRIAERMDTEHRFLITADNRAGYERLLKTRAMHNCWNRLNLITADTLIIAGEFDNQAPLARSQAMAAAIHGAQLLTFPAGHNVCFATQEPAHAIVDHCMT